MQEFLAILIGAVLGIFSGLVPGVHSNTITSILVQLSIDPSFLGFIIIATLAGHTVFEFLPAIFLGIPDENTVVSVLPGQRMLLQGRSAEAIRTCAFSLLLSTLLSLMLFPLSLVLFPLLFSFVEPLMLPFLLAASLFLLLTEKEVQKIAFASLIFLLSGTFGFFVLNSPVKDPLFPAFTGLFAMSSLIASVRTKQELPEQKDRPFNFDFLKFVAAGVVLGMLADLFPGISAPAQIAVFASAFLVFGEPRHYLALVSSIAASHAIFGFSSLIAINKARMGALVALRDVVEISLPTALPYIAAFALVVGLASLALLFFSRRAKELVKVNFTHFNLVLIFYILGLVLIICGPAGIIILAASTAIGSLPLFLGVRRTHVMGLIIVPSIIAAAGKVF